MNVYRCTPKFMAMILLTCQQAYSQVPQLLHFQGTVAEHRSKFDGVGEFRFSLVNSNGSKTFWSNDGTGTSGGIPAKSVPIVVNKGAFAVTLGDVTLPNMIPVPATVFTNEDVRLRIWFQTGKYEVQQLSPDQRIVAVGYAMVAATIPDQTVTAAKLATSAVTSDKIAAGAVQTLQVADGAITAAKLAPGVIGPILIPPGSITSIQLADGSVTSAKIADQAVHGQHISAGSIGSTQLGLASVESQHVAAGAIKTPQIADGTITTAKIASQAVTAEKLAPQAAVDNLSADGFGAVPSTAMLCSPEENSAALLSAGYTKAGSFDMVPDSWEPRAPLGNSTRRHTAVWTGSEMIVWGGFTSSPGDGGRYNPKTDTWRSVTAAGEPLTPRSRHVAVWTGREMLVWGGIGSSGSGDYGDGGRYDPATDTWRPITRVGAPIARDSMTAVWAQGAMIVWGGRLITVSGTVILGDGGLYYPDRDEWVALPATAVISARSYHTAVWTGQEMIVWGGQDISGAVLASGARFDPVTMQWIALPSINAPESRYFHTAIWTGQEMIVWGGNQVGGPYFRNGGGFLPHSGLWYPLSTVSAPSARAVHSAVWTGKEMIVHGGEVSGRLQATGGRYDPESDRWISTTTDGSTTAQEHTAVWTGDGMVIFSGSTVENANQFWRPETKLYLYKR